MNNENNTFSAELAKEKAHALATDCATLVRQAANMYCDVHVEQCKNKETDLVARLDVHEPSHIDALNIHTELCAAFGSERLLWESERGRLVWYIHATY